MDTRGADVFIVVVPSLHNTDSIDGALIPRAAQGLIQHNLQFWCLTSQLGIETAGTIKDQSRFTSSPPFNGVLMKLRSRGIKELIGTTFGQKVLCGEIRAQGQHVTDISAIEAHFREPAEMNMSIGAISLDILLAGFLLTYPSKQQ